MSAMKTLPFTPASAPRVRLVTVEQCWTVCEGSTVRAGERLQRDRWHAFAGELGERYIGDMNNGAWIKGVAAARALPNNWAHGENLPSPGAAIAVS